MKQKSSTFPLRLPVSLKDAVAEVSREDNTGINQFVVVAVAEKLSAMRTAEFFAERRRGADREAAIAILSRDGVQAPGPEDEWPVEQYPGRTSTLSCCPYR